MAGFSRHASVDNSLKISVLVAPRLYSFPHNNRRLFTRGENFRYENLEVHSISIFNLAIINKIWVACAIFFALLRFSLSAAVRRCPVPEIIVNIPTPYIEAPLFFWKKIFCRRAKTLLIIPDIPSMVEAMNNRSTSSLKGRLVASMNRYAMKLASKFNSFVFLAEAMKEFFPFPVRYIVMEGIASPKENEESEAKNCNWESRQPKGEVKKILYTGTLASAFGIRDLLKAFRLADLEGVELHICGSGETADEIRQMAKEESRIIFHGLVDASEARRMQMEADLLVNPRTSSGEYTRFSFPSKILEYMLTGKPVVMHALPGIPKEYLKAAFIPQNESPQALAEEFKRIFALSDEERQTVGLKGKQLAEKKNPAQQTARILHLSASQN